MLPEQAREVSRPDAEARGSSDAVTRSSAPCSISFSARSTVLRVPFHAGHHGATSGRQRRQGRYPAASAAGALGRKDTLRVAAGRAGQIGLQ